MNTLRFLFFISYSSFLLNAQSNLKLTDYYNNPSSYNPAYIGVTEGMFLKGYYTSQWTDFEGSPSTQVVDLQNNFDNKNMAVGISILNDTFGALKNLKTDVNFSLNFKSSQDISFSLGLKAGINSFSTDYQNLNILDRSEFVFNENISKIIPLVGVGFYTHGDNWFLGISSPNIIENKVSTESDEVLFKSTNQYFSSFGYNFYLDDFLFKNQFLTQIIEGFPISYIFSTKIIFKNYVSLSINYHPQYLAGGEIGIYLPGNLKIAYGMDMSNTNGISKYDNNYRFSISFQVFRGKANWSDRQEFDKPYIIR
ncbi:MAG: type IX secretion system membrane protein PorP/SprF [Flavobacteriales bacterium TMED96]|nr:MAG: type IX secretion system membrane protein PorP/SprF [Flavobacteriales bacterium TMED96]